MKNILILTSSALVLVTIFSFCQLNGATSGIINLIKAKQYQTKSYAKEQTSSVNLGENDFNIFRVTTIGNHSEIDDIKAFVSLSDIYYDSLAVPPQYIANQKNMSFGELKYFELSSAYRKKLLKGIKINEKDTMFIYDYGLNKLERVPLKKLKAVAHLTPYASEGEQIFDGDYMIGFELSRDVMKKSAMQYYNNVLVYIGSKNPFVLGQLKLAEWQKINENDFPKFYMKQEFNEDRYEAGNSYQFKSDTITYYLRDVLFENKITKRHFIAVGKSGKNMITEKIFEESEGTSLAPLSFVDNDATSIGEQWTGILFKNKPPVIFGFEYHSFGCPSILLLDKTYAEIPINCDNRH